MTRSQRPDSSSSTAATQHVRVLGASVPAWALVAAVAIVAAGVGALVAPTQRTAAVVPQAVTNSASTPAPCLDSALPAVSHAPARSLIERARRGDFVALKRLEKHPRQRRPLSETLAIASGHAAIGKADAARFVADVKADPSLMNDANTLRLLHRHAHDPAVASMVLGTLAQLDHPRAPDLLYEVWTEAVHHPTADLAEDLIHHEDVRARATKALDVVLELRATKRCRKVRDLLPDLLEHGDRRARPDVKRLRRTVGCGPKGREDCYPCLREADVEAKLTRVWESIRARPAPEPWITRRVQRFDEAK